MQYSAINFHCSPSPPLHCAYRLQRSTKVEILRENSFMRLLLYRLIRHEVTSVQSVF